MKKDNKNNSFYRIKKLKTYESKMSFFSSMVVKKKG